MSASLSQLYANKINQKNKKTRSIIGKEGSQKTPCALVYKALVTEMRLDAHGSLLREYNVQIVERHGYSTKSHRRNRKMKRECSL